MWKVKNKQVKRVTPEEIKQRKIPVGRMLMLELSIVFTNGDENIEVSTFPALKYKKI
jgi:hypothetical protein